MECALNDYNLRDTELRLGLPGTGDISEKSSATRGSKRAKCENESLAKNKSFEGVSNSESSQETPRAKAQVIGWPPIQAYRRNNSGSFQLKEDGQTMGLYVKVSMDGVPYLRKIDLKMYKSYKELKEALNNMFKYFSLGEVSKKERENEYTITYEDKDRDLMLVGDVPWE
ncbi:hypothetical protein ZIOFF_042824 [Zingiber officinale]|uniref:Auxin-responsive protein n=2 Tax=Zingiber officinale TaxID=94328 RepID=A0A8J5FTW1_ZINOF|nr:hypothetical protein ZIOFF_042824 [Zingiber officinale]